MQQLVERVLAVRTRLAENHGARTVRHGQAVMADALAVRLHVGLLQVGGQPVQVLVVGQDGVNADALDVAIPDADEGKQHGHVAREGRLGEVPVHRVTAGQQLAEAVGPDLERDRQADHGPQGVAAPDPVPEGEGVPGSNAESGDGLGVGRQRHEVAGNRVPVHPPGQEPVEGTARIGHRLERREGLGRDDEQGRGGVESVQDIAEVLPVDVRHEMTAPARDPVGTQRLHGHLRPQVGTADTDVHHVGQRLARRPAIGARVHRIDEGEHSIALGGSHGAGILAVDEHLASRAIAQRGVQHRAILAAIDPLTAEHGGDRRVEFARRGEREESVERGWRYAVLREIEVQSRRLDAEALGATGIRGKQVIDAAGRERLLLSLQCRPGPLGGTHE